MLVCIISIVDATANMPHLVKKVMHKDKNSNLSSTSTDGDNLKSLTSIDLVTTKKSRHTYKVSYESAADGEQEPKAGRQQESGGLKKTLAGSDNKDARTSANCYDKSKWKFSFNTVRIWYCWILVHAILITIAANTYEWSWSTNDLIVLANTAMLFLTSVVYLLLLAAMIMQHVVFFLVAAIMWHTSCCCKENCSTEQYDEILPKFNREETEKRNLFFSLMLTTGLVVSNTLCMITTLVVFFYPVSSNRTVGISVVLVHIIATSTIWLICSCLTKTSTSESVCYVTIRCFALLACFLYSVIFVSLLIVFIHLDASLWLMLLFLLLLPVWIVTCIIVCIWIHLRKHQPKLDDEIELQDLKINTSQFACNVTVDSNALV